MANAIKTIKIMPASSMQGEVHLPADEREIIDYFALHLAANSIPDQDRVEEINKAQNSVLVDIMMDVLQQNENQWFSENPIVDTGSSSRLFALLIAAFAVRSGIDVTISGEDNFDKPKLTELLAPLAAMGANISKLDSRAVRIQNGDSFAGLKAIKYTLPHNAPWLQESLLIATAFAEGESELAGFTTLPLNLEMLLKNSGVSMRREDGVLKIVGVGEAGLNVNPTAPKMVAAKELLGALLVPTIALHGSLIRVPDVDNRKAYSGIFEVLDQMNARIAITDKTSDVWGEIGNLEAKTAVLSRGFIEEEQVQRMVDYLPFFALMSHFCQGETVVRGVSDLRLEGADLIGRLGSFFKAIGMSFQTLRDGFIVNGNAARFRGGIINTDNDYRLAMLAGVAGLLSRDGVEIIGYECVEERFPGYYDLLNNLAVRS